jgi:maltose alpha-D-glucosyltransferase/alpha-amylase
VLYDGIGSGFFWKEALAAIGGKRSWKGRAGVCRTWKAQAKIPPGSDRQGPCVFANRSNSCVAMEDCFFKLFRKLEADVNPEIEIELMLAKKRFPNVPGLVGTLSYYPRGGGEQSLGVVSRTIADCENAWGFSLQALELFWDHLLASPPDFCAEGTPSLLNAAGMEFPAGVKEGGGAYLEFARFLGQRAGELHQALADPEERGFAPESFTPFYLRSLYQSQRNRVLEATEAIGSRLENMPPAQKAVANKLLAQQAEILSRLKAIHRPGLQGVRIRCHGSFQLQEVLSTGKDFYFIDFEGDPSRPASERRIKRPPAFDLAKMIYSFHLAALTALGARSGTIGTEKSGHLRRGGELWAYWASVSFLKGYIKATEAGALAQSPGDLELLLGCHLVDRGAKETSRTLQNESRNEFSAQAGIALGAWTAMLRLWNLQ